MVQPNKANNDNTLSQQEVYSKVSSRKDLHSALERNQYILPPLKDPIMTNKFMAGKFACNTFFTNTLTPLICTTLVSFSFTLS